MHFFSLPHLNLIKKDGKNSELKCYLELAHYMCLKYERKRKLLNNLRDVTFGALR